MGRRRVAVVATVLVAIAAGTGVARAYYAPGSQDITSAEGYFTFCADRQRDVAGITAADLTAANYGIDTYIDAGPGAPAGTTLSGSSGFVLGKSGIDGVNRRVVTTQLVEYDTVDAATRQPIQIRCKLRTRESLLRTDMQRLDSGTATSTPWGFGPLAATGVEKTCRQVQQDLVTQVYDELVTGGDDPVYDVGSPTLVFDPETVTAVGPNWIVGTKVASVTGGVLHVGSSAVYNPSSDSITGPDRFYGAHYCIFLAPEYIRSVLLGGPVF